MFVRKREGKLLKRREDHSTMSRQGSRKSVSPCGSEKSMKKKRPDKEKNKAKVNKILTGRPEALTFDDFLLIDFDGGRPQIFVDFIKHMTGKNYYKLCNNAPPKQKHSR